MHVTIDEELTGRCQETAGINRQNLMRLLDDNKNTEYGIKYGFSDITDVDAYRKRVPLTDYAGYRSYVDRMLRGEKNILTTYEIAGYCRSSGTMGKKRKNIPISVTQLETFGNHWNCYVDGLVKKDGGKRLQIATWRTFPGDEEKKLLLTEIVYRYFAEQGIMDLEDYIGGKELLFEKEPGEFLYARCFASLIEERIVLIESIYLYEVLHFFSYLEKNWERILGDIRRNVIPEEISLSTGIRKRLLSMDVSEERLRYVEKECRKGFDGIAGRLFPGLRLISGISSPSYFVEDHALRRYIGDISLYYFIFCASECYFGNPIAENDFRYVLLPDHAFFEFLPYEEEKRVENTLLPEELETGKCYEVVCTNFSGLYRYCMGDIVRVTDFYKQSPVVEFVTRRDLALSIAGEKVRLSQLEQVIKEIRQKGADISEYCFAADMDQLPANYIAAVSMEGNTEVGEQLLGEWIDVLLRKENPDYDDLRGLGELACVKAQIFTDLEYRSFMEENHLHSGHGKPRHIAAAGFKKQ